MKNYFSLKNFHLIISATIVISAAFVYGFKPNLFLNVDINTTDEHNILKAIMGLYLAFAVLWIIAMVDEKLWKIATICNMLFMFGLGFGRIISVIIDGFPTDIFIIGTIGELVLGLYALYQFKFHKI